MAGSHTQIASIELIPWHIKLQIHGRYLTACVRFQMWILQIHHVNHSTFPTCQKQRGSTLITAALV